MINFNTSHVNVNHIGKEAVNLASDYFNTSHVNVNHIGGYTGPILVSFQYISC